MQVTTAVRKTGWSARSLLRDVAQSDPPVHALIDTGALITGFDNEGAARYLLKHLPLYFQVPIEKLCAQAHTHTNRDFVFSSL